MKHSDSTKLVLSTGSEFERDIGYARAVVVGQHVYVSGTTGFDYQTMSIPDCVIEQTRQCIANIRATLEAVGGSLTDIVRVVYILPAASDFRGTWPVLREAFGQSRPAATMI